MTTKAIVLTTDILHDGKTIPAGTKVASITLCEGMTVDQALSLAKMAHALVTDCDGTEVGEVATEKDSDDATDDITKMSVGQLKEVASKLGLTVPSRGSKQLLISMIEAAKKEAEEAAKKPADQNGGDPPLDSQP